MLRLYAIPILALLLTTPALGGPQATGHIIGQAGQVYPQSYLTDFLEPGTGYRLKIFGGAKLSLGFVGALGLGWDLTYSEHAIKQADNYDSSFYRRFTWDWFGFDLNLGLGPIGLNIRPQLSWVVTDIDILDPSDANTVKETSIRPGGALNLGLRLAVASNIALALDSRMERTANDQERTNSNEDFNITGDFVSVWAGAMIYF